MRLGPGILPLHARLRLGDERGCRGGFRGGDDRGRREEGSDATDGERAARCGGRPFPAQARARGSARRGAWGSRV